MQKIASRLALGAGLLAIAVSAQATILDFEDLGVPAGTQYDPSDFAVTTSGGFDFIHGPLNSFSDLHFPNGSSNAVGSTTELAAHEDVIMTRSGGGAFSLIRFDWGSVLLEERSFTIEGTLSGGGLVSQTFIADQDETTLQTFFLNPSFSNLVSAKWIHIGGNTGVQNLDNIEVGAPGNSQIPEPASLALLGIGLAGLAAARRRTA